MDDNRILGTGGAALYFEEVRRKKVARIVEIRLYKDGMPASLPEVGDFVWLKAEDKPFEVIGRVWAYNGNPQQAVDCFVSLYVRQRGASPLRILMSWPKVLRSYVTRKLKRELR